MGTFQFHPPNVNIVVAPGEPPFAVGTLNAEGYFHTFLNRQKSKVNQDQEKKSLSMERDFTSDPDQERDSPVALQIIFTTIQPNYKFSAAKPQPIFWGFRFIRGNSFFVSGT